MPPKRLRLLTTEASAPLCVSASYAPVKTSPVATVLHSAGSTVHSITSLSHLANLMSPMADRLSMAGSSSRRSRIVDSISPRTGTDLTSSQMSNPTSAATKLGGLGDPSTSSIVPVLTAERSGGCGTRTD